MHDILAGQHCLIILMNELGTHGFKISRLFFTRITYGKITFDNIRL